MLLGVRSEFLPSLAAFDPPPTFVADGGDNQTKREEQKRGREEDGT